LKRRRRRRRWHEFLYYLFVQRLYSRDLYVDLQLAAKRETVAYIRRYMKACVLFWDRHSLLAYALSEAPSVGSVLEFGVERGTSITLIAKRLAPRTVHGFDSFEGLPENWSGAFRIKGDFGMGGVLPKVPPNAVLHKGWFTQTLPAYLASTDEPIAFLHIDCDLYSSTRDVFALIGDRLVPGTIIVFDEYFGYPNWREHEFKAFAEFVEASGRRYEYVGHAVRDGHVIVRITL
jgi:predicted O-methyltransferase YrrM